ncbi:MAG: AsmA family protein, partial [Myxococcaceae bacterium]
MSAAPPTETPKRERKWLKRTLWALIALLTLLVLAIVGVYAYLTSGAGEARVKATAISAVNDQLAGHVEAGSVQLSANDLVFEDLKLFDPEGELVAQIKRVEVKLTPTQLLGKEIRINEAMVTGASLHLKIDRRGFNLQRAIAAKELRPSDLTGTKSEPKPFAFKLDHFKLESGDVEFVEEL